MNGALLKRIHNIGWNVDQDAPLNLPHAQTQRVQPQTVDTMFSRRIYQELRVTASTLAPLNHQTDCANVASLSSLP